MLIVAVFLTVAFAVTVVSLGGLLRSQQRAHARREDLLLNQLLHTVGKPWTQAPADEDRLALLDQARREHQAAVGSYVMSPEQLPIDQ